MDDDDRPRRALAAILAAFAALALGFNLAVPLGEAPDEPSHLQMVLFLRQQRRLPSLPPADVADAPDLAAGPQAKHPPLYYLIGALLSAPFGVDGLGFVTLPTFVHDLDAPTLPNRFAHPPDVGPLATPGDRAARAARLASLLGGALLVVGAWRLARRLWPRDRGAAATAAAVVAFTPGIAWLSGVFHNDTLAAGASAMTLAAAAGVAVDGDPRARRDRPAVLGAWLGVALLSKLTTVFLLPTAALALALGARAATHGAGRGAAVRRFVADGAVAGAAAAVIAGGWFARNALRYGWRDPLGWRRWAARIPELEREVPLTAELGRYLTVQFESYWGRFGWMTIRLPDAAYLALAAAAAVAACGWLAMAAGAVRRARRAHRGGRVAGAEAGAIGGGDDDRGAAGAARRPGSDADRRALAIVVAAVALGYASIVRLGLRFDLVVAQGRYLYIIAAPLAVLFVAGWRAVVPRRAWPGAARAAVGGQLALSAAALLGVVAPAHRPPPAAAPLVADAARGDGAAVVVAVDGRLAVTAVARRAGDDTGPGGRLQLAWRSVRPFYFELIGSDGGPVAVLDQAVATAWEGGRETARVVATPLDGRFASISWPVGRTVRHDVDLPAAFDGADWRLSFVRSDRPDAPLPLDAGARWVDVPAPGR